MIEDEECPVAASPRTAKVEDASHPPETGVDRSTGAMSGTDFQAYIGRGLRAVFDDVAKQPIPDRFVELMKKLG